MKSAEADNGNDLFAQLAIWLAQDFPPEATSAESGRSGPDRQKSSYGLSASSADHATGLHRKDPDSARQLINRPDADLCVAPCQDCRPQGECVCRPGTSRSAASEAQPTTRC